MHDIPPNCRRWKWPASLRPRMRRS
jgi:hypothetical protein